MPIYEYKCNHCGETFEELVFLSDSDQAFPCPACGDEDTCRQMSSFSCGSSNAGDKSAGCAPSGGFS